MSRDIIDYKRRILNFLRDALICQLSKPLQAVLTFKSSSSRGEKHQIGWRHCSNTVKVCAFTWRKYNWCRCANFWAILCSLAYTFKFKSHNEYQRSSSRSVFIQCLDIRCLLTLFSGKFILFIWSRVFFTVKSVASSQFLIVFMQTTTSNSLWFFSANPFNVSKEFFFYCSD